MKRLSTLLLPLVALFITALIVELILQVSHKHVLSIDMLSGPPSADSPPGRNRYIVDPHNGYTGNPAFPEHDEWGYRNSRRPPKADIVTIGDSWTYGAGVSQEHTWPILLSNETGKLVYNMGIPGLGPIQYLQNFRKSLALKPQLIILSFYFGNDFLVTNKSRQMDLSDIAFEAVSAGTLQEIESLGEKNSYQSLFEHYRNCARPPLQLKRKDRAAAGADRGGFAKLADSLMDWMRENSRLFWLVRTFKNTLWDRMSAQIYGEFDSYVRQLSVEQRKICYPFSDGDWQTVFQNAWRMRSLDLADLRIRTGVDVAKQIIRRIDLESRQLGIDLLVVLFPTKERVFWNRVAKAGVSDADAARDLASIYRNENRIRMEISDFLQANGIRFVDMLPHLEGATRQPFFAHNGFHPNEIGTGIIAEVIRRSLTDDGT